MALNSLPEPLPKRAVAIAVSDRGLHDGDFTKNVVERLKIWEGQ